jgi:hypothetical protein
LVGARAAEEEDGLAGTEARGDADAGAACGVGRGGVRGRVRALRLPAHAARLRRRRRAHHARHCPRLALVQPQPAQVARRRRGRAPPASAGQRRRWGRGQEEVREEQVVGLLRGI